MIQRLVQEPDICVFDLHEAGMLLEPVTERGRAFLASVPREATAPGTPQMEQRGAIFILKQAAPAIAMGASLRQIYAFTYDLTEGGKE